VLEREFKDSICTALTIELLSWIAASAQDFKTAAVLAAAASAVWEGLGTDVEAFGPHLHQDSTQRAGGRPHDDLVDVHLWGLPDCERDGIGDRRRGNGNGPVFPHGVAGVFI